LACASLAIASGVQIIRAHDVAETVQAVRMAEAVLVRMKK
jgi:dihydropteroate synthase